MLFERPHLSGFRAFSPKAYIANILSYLCTGHFNYKTNCREMEIKGVIVMVLGFKPVLKIS